MNSINLTKSLIQYTRWLKWNLVIPKFSTGTCIQNYCLKGVDDNMSPVETDIKFWE